MDPLNAIFRMFDGGGSEPSAPTGPPPMDASEGAGEKEHQRAVTSASVDARREFMSELVRRGRSRVRLGTKSYRVVVTEVKE